MAKFHRDPLGSLTEQLKRKGRDKQTNLRRQAGLSGLARAGRNDVLPSLQIVQVPIGELRRQSRRVRKIDPGHVMDVASSIGELGFCDPILLGKNNLVLDGEIRVEAARLLGLVAVPCIRVDHLSDVEQRVIRLALNRLGEKGEWDLEELKIEFEELILSEAPVEISGFSMAEIDQIVVHDCALEPGPLQLEVDPRAVARLGDIFHLGEHAIICGDACDAGVLDHLLGQDSMVRLVLSDEPYCVPISGHATGGSHREFAMASGKMNEREFLDFNVAWMTAAVWHLCEGGVFGTFIDWRSQPIVWAAAAQLQLTPLDLVVWVKTNAGTGGPYPSQHELLPLFKKGTACHINNIALGNKGRGRSNVWTHPGVSSLGPDSRQGLQDHPMAKPIAMLENAILDFTHRGDIVLDPFLGSGSTLIAAERSGRICRGVEINPRYVDVIIRRFEQTTGKSAMIEGSGETFAELAERRCRENEHRP